MLELSHGKFKLGSMHSPF